MRRYVRSENTTGRPEAVFVRLIEMSLLLPSLFVCAYMLHSLKQSPHRDALQVALNRSDATNRSPTADVPSADIDLDDVMVRVLWQDDRIRWRINDCEISTLMALQEKLRQIALVSRETPVIVQSDSDTPLGDVIDVYDTARNVGFAKVRLGMAREAAG